MRELGPEWIVAGSSPSAAEWFPVVRKRLPDAITLTTNRGIKLFGKDIPTVYFFGDEYLFYPDTFEEYREIARAVQKRGTRVVGLNRSPGVLHEWDITWMDEFLTIEVGCWRPWKFIPGKYTAAHLSGLMCLQYAINNGADAIHLVGMEGYGDGGHYFNDGKDSAVAFDGENKDAVLTSGTIKPFTQAVINACPDVQFTFYGDLNYLVTGDNVTQIKDLSKWNSNSNDAGGDSTPIRSETYPTEPLTS